MRTTLVPVLFAATLGAAACTSQPASSSQAGQPAGQASPAASQPAAQNPGEAPSGSSAASGAQAAAPAAPVPPPPPAPPTFREVTLPPGTAIPVTITSPLASNTSRVEDPVDAEVRKDVSHDGVVVVPAGTQIRGSVTEAQQSGKVKGVARLAFRFSSLTLGDERYDITAAPTIMAAQSTKKKDATKVGIGAGAGAIIGGIVGGGKGAAIGAGVGAGAGSGVVIATRGQEVRVPAGTPLTLTLNEPVTIRVPLDR